MQHQGGGGGVERDGTECGEGREPGERGVGVGGEEGNRVERERKWEGAHTHTKYNDHYENFAQFCSVWFKIVLL